MHTEPAHEGVRHHKPKHMAERFERVIGIVMVAAIVVLAVGLIWGFMQTGQSTPEWMR
jgi:hypothetical protein